jgi:TctA family transporter
MSNEQNTNHSLTSVQCLATLIPLTKKRKGIFPMTNLEKNNTANPHAWSLLLAAAMVFSILSPVGQLAAKVAGY